MALASRAAAAVACVLLALAASAAGAGSHSPAPAPAVDCVSQAATLLDCLDYVQQGSTERRPSAACCGEVKTAVASPVIVGCLCSLAGSKNLGFPIDIKRVLALPGACGASNAAFSKCNISALSPTAEAPAPSTARGSSSGGAAASPPKAAAASSPPMTATALVAAVAAPLLAYCYLF
ncbi:non-specific lipid transfer protein-like 1 [Miscanthus floridulus]|uniref:non-specific lipid transfer protein-like 1 n=1 Tax=Miscanthus floridulus TaxID=154761 RepID=UPI0034590256